MVQIILANLTHSSKVVSFLKDNIGENNSGVYNQEFLCPDGVKAALRRKQMLVAIIDNQIIGAIRFYKKKTKNNISLYQFAINKFYRGQGLLKEMLNTINDVPIHTLCPIESEFNKYYYKTGWCLLEHSEKFNVWVFDN